MENKSSLKVGLSGVLRELGVMDIREDLKHAFDECCRVGDQFDLVLRAPLDRMQRIIAISGIGLRGGKRYACTDDIVLDEDDVQEEVLRILARARGVLTIEDARALIMNGQDPVPARDWRSRAKNID